MSAKSSTSDPGSTENPPARVYLVRHGRTALNADGRLRGRLDPSLDDVGEKEVAQTAAQLANVGIGRVLTSPLVRALRTAQVLAEAAGAPKPTCSEGLIDRDYRAWAGQTKESVIDLWGSLDAAPGVESADALAHRARAVLEELDRWGTEAVALVTHDAVLQTLVDQLAPGTTPDSFHTAGWTLLRAAGEHDWRIERLDISPPG